MSRKGVEEKTPDSTQLSNYLRILGEAIIPTLTTPYSRSLTPSPDNNIPILREVLIPVSKDDLNDVKVVMIPLRRAYLWSNNHISDEDREEREVQRALRAKTLSTRGSSGVKHRDANRARRESDDDESSRELVPLEGKLAENLVDGMAVALEEFGLTASAKTFLESSLQTDVVIDVGAVINELQRMVESPIQGVLEANRIGTIGKLYKNAEVVLDDLMGDVEDMTISSKIKFLEMLLSKVKALSSVEAPGKGGRGPRGMPGLDSGEAEFSQTRSVRINLTNRTGRTKVDKDLGYTGDRPSDDFLNDM